MKKIENIDLLTVAYIKEKIVSAAKVGLYSVSFIISTKRSDIVESMLESLGYMVLISESEFDDTKLLQISYMYPQKNNKRKNVSSTVIGIIPAQKAHEIAEKNFVIKSTLNGIVLEIESNAAKGISDKENIIVEKVSDINFSLDTAAFEYLASYQIAAYASKDGSSIVFKPSRGKYR